MPTDDLHVQLPRTVTISYGDRPSRASLFDSEKQQFVLLKTRSGTVVSPGVIEIAMEVLTDVAEIDRSLQANHGNLGPHQYFKLRGIWSDGAHGSIVLHVELLHHHEDRPALTTQQICEALHDGYGWYGEQDVSVNVAVTITSVNVYSDHFWPVSDGFYEQVREKLFW